jgi:hypothetical protein
VAVIPNVTPVHAAVCGNDRPVTLHTHRRSVSHSMYGTNGNQASVRVPGRSLDSLMDALQIDRIDLMKFNIEGMEFEVLEGFTRRGEVGAYIGSFHFDLAEARDESFLDYFDGYQLSTTHARPQRLKIRAVKRERSSR